MKSRFVKQCFFAASLFGAAAFGGEKSELAIAPFKADITPPMGAPLVGGLNDPTSSVEHPIYAKGFVLRDADKTVAFVAFDYTGLCNRSYSEMKNTIAEAIGTDPDHVAVVSLHLHTAPGPDTDTQLVIDQLNDPTMVQCTDLKDFESVKTKVARAAAASLEELQPVTAIGNAMYPVDRVASNRLMVSPLGGEAGTRWSRCVDEEYYAAPEGLIDGFLRSLTFYNDDQPLLTVHFYATHPQSFYGDGRITYDVPGIAREALEEETGVFQIYCNGGGGNIAMGKYNRGTPEDRAALADRILHAMKMAKTKERKEPVSSFDWAVEKMIITQRTEPEWQDDFNRARLVDKSKEGWERLMGAMVLALNERLRNNPEFELNALAIGSARILTFPGEPFVEYQLAAQKFALPNIMYFSGYNDFALQYVPTKEAFSAGGYEPTWSFTPENEALFMQSIQNVLAKLEQQNATERDRE